LRGLRVLIIDDLEDAREAFSVMLQSSGAQVETAGSAATGLAALTRFKPDVLLCDIAMPGEDGFSFIRKARALKPNQGGKTPAIALTAFAGRENSRQALGAGFDTHLPKPVDALDLSRLIAKLAGRSEK
jgi:CheY-like chemotaxis protein